MALLSKWLEFAQASLALPENAEGDRWRRSVPAIINLQAVTFALDELDTLPAVHRPYARDKAETLIDEHAAALEGIWESSEMPEMVVEALHAAAGGLVAAEWCDLTELIWRGEKPLLMPELEIDELLSQFEQPDCGTLTIAQPGTYIMPGEPLAWWCDIDGEPQRIRERLADSETADASFPRQVFRQFDDDGRIIRDIVAWTDSEGIDGLPLLLPVLVKGERLGGFTLDQEQWEQAQRGQLAGRGVEMIDLTRDGVGRGEEEGDQDA